MTENEIREMLTERYPNDDISISTILIWAEWSTEEEWGNLLIFENKDGIFAQEDGYSVMDNQNDFLWLPDQITEIESYLMRWEDDIKYDARQSASIRAKAGFARLRKLQEKGKQQ